MPTHGASCRPAPRLPARNPDSTMQMRQPAATDNGRDAAVCFPTEAEAGATSRKGWTAGGPAKKSNKFVFLPSPFRIFASKSETMEIKGKFDHFNINVTDLERSIDFYGRALGLHEKGRQKAEDGSF